MGLGVILGNKKLQGSCGGLSSIGVDKRCDCTIVCKDHKTLYQIQEPVD